MGGIRTPKKLPYRLRPDDKLYFFHIIKTAGTTLKTILESHFRGDELCHTPFLEELARMPADALKRARLYIGHVGFKLAEYVPDDLIYLTMLREPMEHVLSVFLANRHAHGRPMNVSREDLIRELRSYITEEKTSHNLWNVQVFTLTLWHTFWTPERLALSLRNARDEADKQAVRDEVKTALRDTPGQLLLEQASARLEKFAFVGLVERMDDSMRLLEATFGWQQCPEVPRLNATSGRLRKEDLPADVLARLEELTRLDRQLYAREQTLFDRRRSQLLGWFPRLLAFPRLRRAA